VVAAEEKRLLPRLENQPHGGFDAVAIGRLLAELQVATVHEDAL
jgi:hypothetical protein